MKYSTLRCDTVNWLPW